MPRPLLIVAAAALAAATSLHAFLWMSAMRRLTNRVEIGFNAGVDMTFNAATSCLPVHNVVSGSPAEVAGLRPGDAIIAINGKPLTTMAPFDETWSNSSPGDVVELTVQRPGESQPLVLRPTFRRPVRERSAEGFAQASARQVTNLYPVFFVLVGFAVLFSRLDDPIAWLLATLFACFVAAPDFSNRHIFSAPVAAFVGAFRGIFAGFLSALLYTFFAIFPRRSWLDRRFPWLKWVALAFAVSQAIPGTLTGNPHWPNFVTSGTDYSFLNSLRVTIGYGFTGLAIVSLLSNSFAPNEPSEARRKSRVILWGTLFGVLPIVTDLLVADLTGRQPSFWLRTTTVLLVLLYPLSFAYAVVKHRVLEIPALLRRSARYVLVQRGYFVLLFLGALGAILLFTRFFSVFFAANSQVGMGLSAGFGVALVWASGPLVKRGTERIDQVFFRSAYDARMILQDLAEKTRTIATRRELTRLLELQIARALHPKSLACYLEGKNGDLVLERGPAPEGPESVQAALPRPQFPFRFGAVFIPRDLDTIPGTLPLLTDLTQRGKAWDVPPGAEAFAMGALAPECLVPILGRNSRLIGLLVLGPRLSEEPYSREDKELLDSVANQAGISLESLDLAEKMAARLEAERRTGHEMQIAREVQSRLFPQVAPPLVTLDYVGGCIQARQVGGDYYDFLDLGSSQRLDRGATHALEAASWHVAFVLADISGKGIAGALLMANLQANLRSRYALALDDLPRLLKSVNQLFYENTPDDRYATLFFAVYDDRTRELEYANCGHNAPLLFRANGSLERLASTSTVIGLFPKWECVTRHIRLDPGDLLIIYTDGVTEANDAFGNEFEETRLIETVRQNIQLPPAELLSRIQDAVRKFSAGTDQFDDLTLVVARAR